MNQWYVRFGDDDPVGPVETEHLVIWIRVGDIPVTSLVARMGDDEWVPLASVPQFADAVGQVAPFAPPTPSPRSATPPTERNWYMSGADGAAAGPFPTSQIMWNIERGTVPAGTLACEVGAGDWQQLEAIPCFAEAFRPPTVAEQQEAATVVFHQPESHAIGSAPAFDPRAPLAGGVQVPEQRPQQRSGAQGGPPPRRPATAPTERSWYISAIDGSTSGPFPKSQLISVIERGSVPYGTMVCEDGASEWQDIKAIPYFAEAFDRLGARVPAQVPAAAIPVQARPERLGQAAPLPPAALKPGLETARAPQKPQGHQGAATGTSGAQKPTVQAPRATGMPLIQCPDCHKQISDAAPACPGCGRPMTQAAPTAPPPFGAQSMGGEVCPASSDRSAPQARGIPKTRKPFAPFLRKTAPIWIGGAVGVSAVVVVLWAVLANDKAQPKYDECVQLESKSDLKGAVAACEAAVATDPKSKSGKAASEKATALKATIEQQAREAAAKQAREAAAREAAKKAVAERAAQAKLQSSICANLDAWKFDNYFGATCGQAATRLGMECINSLMNLGPAMLRTHEMQRTVDFKREVYKVTAKMVGPQVEKLEASAKEIRKHAAAQGEDDVQKTLVADCERLAATYRKWIQAMLGYQGALDPFLAAKQDSEKVEDVIMRNDQKRAQQCFVLEQPK